MIELIMAPGESNIVWVVDDSDACRRLLVLLTRRGGGSPREFLSAEAALQATTVSNAWPMAILTDLVMPGQSGIELIAHLRAAGFSGPIALLSATSDEATRVAAQSAGATAVLSKMDMTVAVPWFVEISVRPAA